MYYFARLARDVEERLVILFRQSKVIGGLYRSLGQEGESVATAYALERRDAVLPLIRNMGALMTVGVRPREIFRQYMAKGTANSRGRDLNIHIVHLPEAESRRAGDRRSDQHARRLDSGGRRHRDGRADEGASRGRDGVDRRRRHEHGRLPRRPELRRGAEDSRWSSSPRTTSTRTRRRSRSRWRSSGSTSAPRRTASRTSSSTATTCSPSTTSRSAWSTGARAGGGAQLIGVDTMRMQGHAQHDDARYVPKALLDEWAAKDPLARFRRVIVDRRRGHREGSRRHRQDDEGVRGEGSGPRRRGADARPGAPSRAASTPATTTRCRRWSWCVAVRRSVRATGTRARSRCSGTLATT